MAQRILESFLVQPATIVSGLLFGLSLIVAIGAQNAFVLRQGLVREHVGVVVAICTVSDIVLIAAGVAGAGAALDGRPWLLDTVRYVGVAFLLGYAVLALRRARTHRQPLTPRGDAVGGVVATCLALTWLNPGVYLDTVVLLGTVSHTRHGSPWWFGAGAMAASVLWFAALGYGSRRLAPLLRSRRAWQVLDLAIAAVMVTTAVRLLLVT